MLLTHNAYPYNGTRKVVIENDYMKDSLSGCVKNDLNLSIGVRMAHDAATTRNIMYMI